MCGFFGSLNYSGEKFDLKSINRALNTLSHRGPDSEGVEKLDNVVFGHKRLAIIDITTDSGKQPVVGQNSLLVFNGMIYNFLEIKLLYVRIILTTMNRSGMKRSGMNRR